ncbi:MAG: oligosaccharide flippase family protein [Gemmatimonadota bacterium]
MSGGSLRAEVLRGGAYLTLRQAAGTAISVVGILLLTRTIGPGAYGVYAAALALYLAVQLFAQMGAHVFLVRMETERGPELYRAASTLLLGLGLLGAGLGVASLPLVARWTGIEGIVAVSVAVFAALPLANLAQVPLARLERALDYRRVAWIELAGQVSYFAVALPLAFWLAPAGHGAWAPTGGFLTQQLVLVVLTHLGARYAPRLHWDGALVREIVHYGGGYTASMGIYQLRRLVNPLVVGRYAGAEAVGTIAVTIQIVGQLSFVAVATWRLSTAALARVQQDTARLRRAISEGMRLQVVAVGPFLVLFAWLAPWLVPLLLGRAWSGIGVVYPFIAVAMLVNAMFNLHSSALYVLRQNGQVAVFHAVQTGLLAGGALVLVPRLGLIGYGLAELLAVASYAVLHGFTARVIGAPTYGRALALGGALALATAYAYLGPWSLTGLVLVALLLRPWREVSGVVADLRTMGRP